MTRHLTLTKSQADAVNHESGTMLVVAGAGTGKTRVIVERIVRLINEGVDPSKILALTFTEKAAQEMLDRVIDSTGTYQLSLPIMTFNSYGEDLLRKYATDIGLSRRFKLLSENGQIVFLRENLDHFNLDYFAPVSRPDALLSDIAGYFSKLKQNIIKPEDYLKYTNQLTSNDEADKFEKIKHQELSTAFDIYIKLCRENNLIDYDDQIYLTIDLLMQRPNITNELRNSYHTIMVDEFQDTNPMQSYLVDILTNENKNLMVVGDDDQSIYGFRGATLANILEFKNRYPNSKEVTLKENFRSGQKILNAAHKLIVNNDPDRLEVKLGIDKKLVSDRVGESPILKHFEKLDEELIWVAEDIKKRIVSGIEPGDIAVISRRNATAKIVSDTLTQCGIDHILSGQSSQLYSNPVVRSIIDCLNTIADPEDSVSLHHTLTSSLFDINPSQIANQAAQIRREHSNLEKILLESSSSELTNALALINSWRSEATLITVYHLVQKVLSESGLRDRLYKAAQQDSRIEEAIVAVGWYFKTLKDFESVAMQPSVFRYLDSLPALMSAGEEIAEDNRDLSEKSVNVLTIHKAKGLEWSIVYIVDCTEGSFPLRNQKPGIQLPPKLSQVLSTAADEHLAEERRLMYVAMTRARDYLILSYSDTHYSPTKRKVSRFINEIFDDEIINTKPVILHSLPVLPNLVEQSGTPIPIPSTILSGDQVSLSVSQITTFLNCPLDFYYCYILNVPTETDPSIVYGTLIHEVIEKINTSLRSREIISKDELKYFLDSSLPKSGFLSKEQRNRFHQKAMKLAIEIYERFMIEQKIPIKVEEPFSFNLKDLRLHVRGRYDAVFDIDGIEIVDYKTTRVDSFEKAKNKANSSKQLTLYALAWKEVYGDLPSKLTLDFVENGLKGSVRKTDRSLNTIKIKLAEIADNIRNGVFDAGSSHDYCRHPEVTK